MREKVKQLVLLLVFISSSILAQSGKYKVAHEHSFATWTIGHVVYKTCETISDINVEMMSSKDDVMRTK